MGYVIPESKSFTLAVEFTSHDLSVLESIGTGANQSTASFVKSLACVAANLKASTKDRDDQKTRNITIRAVQDAVNILEQAKLGLYENEYPGLLIEDLSRWAKSLQQVSFKRTTTDNKRLLTPPEDSALGAIKYLLLGNGLDINTNSEKAMIDTFLTVAEIVFQASGNLTNISALARRYNRNIRNKDPGHVYEDAGYLAQPSYEHMYVNIEWKYSEGDCLKAVFSFWPH
ncbi:MAG: hypothetical protein KZQ90_19835 [Candidatus Thiodiazotropha sp. (ex Codakia rugifera)]|nr:hypothetical protein [Candidatus Thiodiazotropha sp. (ex Codakia rugifera)]